MGPNCVGCSKSAELFSHDLGVCELVPRRPSINATLEQGKLLWKPIFLTYAAIKDAGTRTERVMVPRLQPYLRQRLGRCGWHGQRARKSRFLPIQAILRAANQTICLRFHAACSLFGIIGNSVCGEQVPTGPQHGASPPLGGKKVYNQFPQN